MKTKTVGYIVECETTQGTTRAMQHAKDPGTHVKQLYFGNVATLFPTRARAQGAIVRTMNQRRDFAINNGKLSITRLVAD